MQKILEIDPLQLLQFDRMQYIKSVSHSQAGSGQYIEQAQISEQRIDHLQQQLDILREEVRFLRTLLEKKLGN